MPEKIRKGIMNTSNDTSKVKIRLFTPADREACLAVFDSNTPEYFAAEEHNDFAAFLDAGQPYFFVATAPDEAVIACGGYYIDSNQGTAGLTWGMVHRSWHQHGVGSSLLKYRIAAIRDSREAKVIRVNTSQQSRGFFERHGFRVLKVIPDGYAPGIDRVETEMKLDEARNI